MSPITSLFYLKKQSDQVFIILLLLLNQAFLFSYTSKVLTSISILSILLNSIAISHISEKAHYVFSYPACYFLKIQTTTELFVLVSFSKCHHESLDTLNNTCSMSSSNRFSITIFLYSALMYPLIFPKCITFLSRYCSCPG